MSCLYFPDEVLHFPKHMSIELNYRNAVTYYKRKLYDQKIMNQSFVWHQIVALHYGKLSPVEGKNIILEAIYRTIEGQEFYPIAYRRGEREDRFLVRQCQPAMDKLFAQNLCLHLPRGIFINIKVQLNVGEFKYGQISAISQITKALNSLYGRMETYRGEGGILNLSSFAKNPEFLSVDVNLGNRGVLERVCDLICGDEQFRKVNGIIFRCNGINTLAPFRKFRGVQFAILDLRDNSLCSPNSICRDLEPLAADELMLNGNPVTISVNYPECLNPVLKNFKKIDGIISENLSSEYSPLDNTMEVECVGYRIDGSNKRDINNFEDSKNWHAFMIPDEDHAFSKEKIFDYFFLTISNTASDIYPCYYKFNAGKHQFLVRNCFSQIKHLVESSNLEIKIPSPKAPPLKKDTTDFSPHMPKDEVIAYYLMMNISPFKEGQLEPMKCIEKALSRCFNSVEQILDLNNFQNIEGLGNIVINLSSPSILTRILMYAVRKFLSTCAELRLANNKIFNGSFSKVLFLMCNLKAIDLGDNRINDLDDIKDVGKLGISSLRLDGNPLCSKYIFVGEYINAVKTYFPNLYILDGVKINQENLISFKNFLCDIDGYDFVNEFITRYFHTFENDRVYLRDLYHPKSTFSLTFDYDKAKTNKSMLKYLNFARNFVNKTDSRLAHTTTYFGPNEILNVLMELPNAKHDICNFTTDCTLYSENIIVIVVNGVYTDQASNFWENDVLMGFSRTFILTRGGFEKGLLNSVRNYQIINDQLSVYTPTLDLVKISSQYIKNEEKINKDELTSDDKEAFLALFQEVTNLKSVWCQRCLDDGNGDFVKALEAFLLLCEREEIPDIAFN